MYIFSPSVHVDDTWTAVKTYISDVMKVDAEEAEKEQLYFEEYHPVARLKKIIDTQHKVVDVQKKNKQKDLCSSLLVGGDFADDPKFVRYSSLLHGLFTSAVFIFRLKEYERSQHFRRGFCTSGQQGIV